MKLNRRISVGVGFGILSLIVFMVAHAAPSADEKKPEPLGKNDGTFAGKILAVYERSASRADAGFVIEDAFIAEVRGLRFLVGKTIKREGDVMAGLKVYIPWDNVGSIVESDNVKPFLERPE